MTYFLPNKRTKLKWQPLAKIKSSKSITYCRDGGRRFRNSFMRLRSGWPPEFKKRARGKSLMIMKAWLYSNKIPLQAKFNLGGLFELMIDIRRMTELTTL